MGVFVFLLIGCETGSSPPNVNYLAQFPLPKKWKAETVSEPAYHPDRFWISDFSDENLDGFVREVLKCNRDIKSAEARIQLAANNARIVGADRYPEIDGKFTQQRQKANFIGFPIPGLDTGNNGGVFSNRFNQFGLLLDATWEVDLWGTVKAAQTEAIAQMEASQNDMAAIQLSIAGAAVKTWFVLAEAQEQLELAKSTLTTFQKTENSIRDRFEQGIEQGNTASLGSQLLLAQTDVATARDGVAAREEIVSRTARGLEVLAGRYPCGEAGKEARLPDFPGKRPIDLPCTILDRRPDLVAAERRLAAADQKLVQAKRAVLPTIKLTSSYGTSTDQISQLLNGDFSVWSIAGDMIAPVFRAGLIKAAKQTVLYEIELAKTEYEKAILTAFSEVENALSAEKFLKERVKAMSKAAELSKEAYQRSGEEYINGTGDLLTMLTSQQRMFSQESQLISLRRQQLEARVDLHIALAGSFEALECINTDPLAP